MDTSRTKFSVENLGAIRSGEFTVKPLTLFCGPNNTGKTWLMYTIYAFWRHLRVPQLKGMDHVHEKLKETGSYKGDINGWLHDHAGNYIKKSGLIYPELFSDIFNADETLFENSKFNWEIDQETFIQSVIKKEFREHDNKVLRVNKPEGSSNLEVTLVSNETPGMGELEYRLSLIFSRLFLDLPHPFLMPAERNGLHLFFRELSAKRTALLHHASKEKIDLSQLFRDVMRSRYALPIADYIDWLNDLPSFRKRSSSPFHVMAEAVRRKVSYGKYIVNRDGDISFRPRKLNWDSSEQAPLDMGLHATSSTVKSLFGLWFYLENDATFGNALMIDEPELHLHPSHQRALARILAQLVNEGLWVIVSTHSDYLVREINSLIMLHTDHEERDTLMKKYKFAKEQLLDKNKVAAYLVDDRAVSPMPVTPDEGIIAETFDKVINALNDSSNDIYYKYRESQ